MSVRCLPACHSPPPPCSSWCMQNMRRSSKRRGHSKKPGRPIYRWCVCIIACTASRASCVRPLTRLPNCHHPPKLQLLLHGRPSTFIRLDGRTDGWRMNGRGQGNEEKGWGEGQSSLSAVANCIHRTCNLVHVLRTIPYIYVHARWMHFLLIFRASNSSRSFVGFKKDKNTQREAEILRPPQQFDLYYVHMSVDFFLLFLCAQPTTSARSASIPPKTVLHTVW